MPRKALIAANWKMYKTPAEAKAFVDAFLPLVVGHTRDEIALFPSPVLLPTVIAAAKGSNVAIGAQNIHFAEEGAYTGETSLNQLQAVGGTHTLIGHSERRQYFAETDEIVNKKLHAALKHGVVPVVCTAASSRTTRRLRLTAHPASSRIRLPALLVGLDHPKNGLVHPPYPVVLLDCSSRFSRITGIIGADAFSLTMP
jgi:triosephosphate isomerase